MTTREYMAKKLHEFRLEKGLSVDYVGAKIGKSGKTISAWEVGRGQPDADKLVQLCALYDKHIADFYSNETSGATALNDQEEGLLNIYRRLNADGQQRVVGYARDLADLPRYTEQKRDGAPASLPQVSDA